MRVLLDNGHGENTKGKRSPDGSFMEFSYAREIAHRIELELRGKGYDVERIVKENIDVPLSERVRRVNEHCSEIGASNVLLVSIHCNASGNGDWRNARGWSAYTCKERTKSDELATFLYIEAVRNFSGQTIRKDFSDGDDDWEEDFYILKNSKCAAVLTENFFMDNKEDLAFLTSADGKEAIVKTHIYGIMNFINKYGKV